VIEKVRTSEAANVDFEAQDGLRINVRLLPGVHGALFAELLSVSRGFRTARAIQLMTVGLTHERAGVSGAPTAQTTTDTPHGPWSGSPPDENENRLFVSAVLESSAEGQ